MIELRWIIKHGTDRRELQYRYLVDFHDVDSGHYKQWTDWKNIEYFVE